ncbi:hypothetical protein H5410_012848 [Solanum commersonii]|uniref:Uncharacterized protein n=1 Tax=Solanum commersonii TaxID=4109 RepID=A0A9J6ASU3_SOLCO|nr:hypothetical protein H5410_012848 [Solanum commersonii]
MKILTGQKTGLNRLHDPITMAKQSSKKSKLKRRHMEKHLRKGVERLPRPYPDLHYQRMVSTRPRRNMLARMMILKPKSDYTPPTEDDLVNVE